MLQMGAGRTDVLFDPFFIVIGLPAAQVRAVSGRSNQVIQDVFAVRIHVAAC